MCNLTKLVKYAILSAEKDLSICNENIERGNVMARIVSRMLCDMITQIPTSNGDVYGLTNPLLMLRPAYIPGNYSFGLAMGLADIDISVDHQMRYEVLSPDGVILNASENTTISAIEKDKGETAPAEWQGYMITISVHNLPIQKEGVYRFILYVNDEKLESIEIPVYKAVAE